MADQKPDDPGQNEQPDEVLSLHDDLDSASAPVGGHDHDESAEDADQHRDPADATAQHANPNDDIATPSEAQMSEPQLPVTTTVVKRGSFASALALLLSLLALAASGYVWWLQQNMAPGTVAATSADPQQTRELIDQAAQDLGERVGATDTALGRLSDDVAALTDQVDALAALPPAAADTSASTTHPTDLTAGGTGAQGTFDNSAFEGASNDNATGQVPAILESPDMQVPSPLAALQTEATGAALAAQNEQTLAALAAIDTLQSRLGSIESSQAEQVNDISRIEQGIADAVAEAQQSIVQTIEAANTDNRAARREWLLAETEYLLQTANTALQMANDPEAALAALQGADERLQSLADPNLTATREVLSDEIAALVALPRPDIQGIALTLGSLAARVELLPLLAGAEERYDEAGTGEAPEQPGWRRAVGAFKNALGGMVSVQKDNADIAPLLAPQQRFFLYRNLELQLESARLAALRADNANYSESLNAATRWLNNRFDVSQPAVGSALATLDELAQADVAPERPDIAGSLSALREVMAP